MNGSQSTRGQIVQDLAYRHGVSVDAVEALVQAISAGGGTMAQFSHPDLGGMGQWSRGGMLMIGDMFNSGLKYRVDGLCTDISDLLQREPALAPARAGFGGGGWWPEEFGTPSSSGAQNDLRYAFFPGTQRLAVSRGGETAVYDTGAHMISGVSQQQGGDQSLTFTSQFGTVRLGDLRRIQGDETEATDEVAPSAPPISNFAAPFEPAPAVEPKPAAPEVRRASGDAPQGAGRHPAESASPDDVFAKLERLAALRDKGILSDEEFIAKKTELLARI